MQQHAIKSCHSSRSVTQRSNLHRGISPLRECCQCRNHRCRTFHRPPMHSTQCCCVIPTGHHSKCPPPHSLGARRLQTPPLDPATYRVTVRRITPSHMIPGCGQSNENDENKTNLHSTADPSSIPSVPCRSMISERRDIQLSSNSLLIATAAQVRTLSSIAGLLVFLRGRFRAAVPTIPCQGSTASKIIQSMGYRPV